MAKDACCLKDACCHKAEEIVSRNPRRAYDKDGQEIKPAVARSSKQLSDGSKTLCTAPTTL
jgi:hypothetical protein